MLQGLGGDELAVFVLQGLEVEAAQPPVRVAHAQGSAIFAEQQRVFKGELAHLPVGQIAGDAQKQFLFALHAPVRRLAIDQHARKLDAAGGVAGGKDLLPDVCLVHQRRRAAEHVGIGGEDHAVQWAAGAVGIAQALPDLQRLFFLEKRKFQLAGIPRDGGLGVGVAEEDGCQRAQHQQDGQHQRQYAREALLLFAHISRWSGSRSAARRRSGRGRRSCRR